MVLRRITERGLLACLIAVNLMLAWNMTARSLHAQEKKAAEKEPAKVEETKKAEEPKKSAQSSFGWFYEAEGIFFWPQLAISVITVSFIVINSIEMFRSRFINDAFKAQFQSMTENRQFKEAFDAAKADKSLLGRLLVAGLSRINDGHSEAMAAVQELGDDENMRYEHRLSYLAMIGNIATLVGLLGTVWGMVGSFIVISSSDATPKPSELAKGVSQALVTTICGLIQAIPRSSRLRFSKTSCPAGCSKLVLPSNN